MGDGKRVPPPKAEPQRTAAVSVQRERKRSLFLTVRRICLCRIEANPAGRLKGFSAKLQEGRTGFIKNSNKNTGLRYHLRIGNLARKDYGRHKHTDWRFLFVWLLQTSAATVFFLVSLGALIACGWGVFSYLEWAPGPEGVSALQNLEWYVQGYKISHYVNTAVNFFKTFCTNGYVHCVLLCLVLFFVFIEALSVFLNRLSAVWGIRRYDI